MPTVAFTKINTAGAGAPTSTDDTSEGYSVLSVWAHGADIYICTDATEGAAVWQRVQPYDVDILKSDTADTLTAGFDATDHDAGTKSTGTFTPAPADGNYQLAVNGGAHTLAPPATSCNIAIHYTNNGSAGTITTSGFTVVDGDDLTTTDTHEFIFNIQKIGDVSWLNVKALQ